MSDETPTLFTPYNQTIRNSIAKAIETELSMVPANTREVQVTYDHAGGVLRVTSAVRIDRDTWAVGFGGYAEQKRDRGLGAGAFAKVTW